MDYSENTFKMNYSENATKYRKMVYSVNTIKWTTVKCYEYGQKSKYHAIQKRDNRENQQKCTTVKM